MRRLTRTISRILKNSNACVIYRDEFERVWPGNPKQRRYQMEHFAREHGWKLRSYDEETFVIFERNNCNSIAATQWSMTPDALEEFTHAPDRRKPGGGLARPVDHRILIRRANTALSWTFKLVEDRMLLSGQMKRYCLVQRLQRAENGDRMPLRHAPANRSRHRH